MGYEVWRSVARDTLSGELFISQQGLSILGRKAVFA